MQATQVINPKTDVPFTIRLLQPGESYGLNQSLTHNEEEPLIEVYDARFDGEPDLGQFIGRYYISTFMSVNGALDLHESVPDWTLNTDAVKQSQQWLQAVIL